MTLMQQVKEARIKAGYTHMDIALKLGLTLTYVKNIEVGKLPSTKVLKQLASFYNCTFVIYGEPNDTSFH